jgi:hypothetical protein
MLMNKNMCIGGWTQKWKQKPPDCFSYVMYGMVTTLDELKTGGGQGPNKPPINTGSVKSLWTYGGGFCKPKGYPKTANDIKAIVDATVKNKWAGVDFDDECKMNTDNIIQAMKQLKDAGKETSYTFIAGWDYNNKKPSQAIVKKVADSSYCDRFILMCYDAAMWDDQTIKDNVGPAIQKTIEFTGDSKKVILALTPAGLTPKNLKDFLDYTQNNNLGGMFIWNFLSLKPSDLETIVKTLLP